MSKINLNKAELKKQQEKLASYQKFLPLLELKKEQLQTESRKLQREFIKQNIELKNSLNDFEKYSSLFNQIDLSIFLSKPEVSTRNSNFCGLEVIKLLKINFPIKEYCLDNSPPWLEMLLDRVISYKKLFLNNILLKKEFLLIQHEHSKVSQRVNLFTTILSPQAKEKIKKIKIFLDDQQTAFVVRSKKCKELSKMKKL